MGTFVGYLRVSTSEQGVSGLGLGAQREAVDRFLASQDPPGVMVTSFTETESGKRHENRPQLQAALEHCRRHHCTLLIATLDRLGRNMAFIAGLMETKIAFLAADKPTASSFELHIYAAVAEEERRKISERTRAALAVKKIQLAAAGRRLGNPNCREALKLARAARQPTPPAPEVLRLMHGWRQEGRSYQSIAAELNRLKIRTGRDSEWYASTVRAQLTALQRPSQEAPAEQAAITPPSDDQRQPVASPPPQPSLAPAQQQRRPLDQNGIPMTEIQHQAWLQRRQSQAQRR